MLKRSDDGRESQDNLTPDLAALSHIIDGQPPEMHELLHYALAMLVVEDDKASSPF